VDTVDVWLNNTKVAEDLAFRKATPMFTVTPGMYDVTITKKFSVDTSAAVTLYKVGVSFLAGSTWREVIKGVVDPNQYAPNPNGLGTEFSISSINGNEGTIAGQVELNMYTSGTDFPAVDFNEIGLPGLTKIANNQTYNSISLPVSFAAANTIFNLTSADSTIFYGAYKLNMTGLGAKTALIINSGMFDTTGNPVAAKKMGLFAVYNDGVVTELTKLTGEVQIVHNSADVTADTVDVYVNGVKTLTKFAFRSATPFMSLNAKVPYSIAIAPKNSANVGAAFYTGTLVLDSNTNHYAIVAGVRNIGQYAANPNGRNIAFKLFTYSGARKLATNVKNTDLLYFHGATDLRTTTIIGVGQVQFLSKSDSYGDFHGYAVHSSQDNIRYEIMDAVQDTTMKVAFGYLATHQSKAGLVFSSGFLADSTNQNGDTLILFVAWPDGDVDSLVAPKPVTGLKETIANATLSIYPNPAKDIVNVSLELNTGVIIMSEVFDITGKSVLFEENKGVKGENIITLQAASLHSGIYFLSIKAGDQIITRKISISK
jgi:hypothetical protein